jgi:hypothetical protein
VNLTEPEIEQYRDLGRQTFIEGYDPKLLHHGPPHLDISVDNYLAEVKYCEANGLYFTRTEEIGGIWGESAHDYLTFKPVEEPYTSPEARAAFIAECEGINAGLSHEEAEEAYRVVMATNPDVTHLTTNQIAGRWGDIGNVKGPYQQFQQDTNNNYDEYVLLSQERGEKPMELPEWFDEVACIKFLIPLLKPKLIYGKFDETQSGLSKGQVKAYTNIDRRRQQEGLTLLSEDQKAIAA